jgi:DNA-binding transcriptional ArsR family regulator
VNSSASLGPELLAEKLGALASAPRLRILEALSEEDLHVSELARRMGMSRQLLYLHLSKLEGAGYVAGTLELGADGKAVKTYRLLPFTIVLTMDTILAEIRDSAADTP